MKMTDKKNPCGCGCIGPKQSDKKSVKKRKEKRGNAKKGPIMNRKRG